MKKYKYNISFIYTFCKIVFLMNNYATDYMGKIIFYNLNSCSWYNYYKK